MKYLFWNTNKNERINSTICELVVENNISMIILAEYVADPTELIALLSDCGLHIEQYGSCSERIKIFGRVGNIDYRTDTDHAIIRIINNKDILCCVHLNSQIYSGNTDGREILITQIVEDIRAVEIELNTENTIVVGDFNINPYDSSFLNARYFHAIPVYTETKRRCRTVSGKDFFMFYNPMWNLLGDSHEPYGTYYYGGSDAVNPFWNIYDQVIIRPALRERFVTDGLKILTETQSRYFLNQNGHPNKSISDHLPIVFEIKED